VYRLNRNFGTGLHIAAAYRSIKVLILLLSMGADPDARNVDNGTPLHKVVDGFMDAKRLEVIERLLKSGANPNLRDCYGRSPLHRLCERDYFDSYIEAAARLLIENGADINARTKWGITPLMTALSYSNRGIGLFLVKNGADIEPLGQDGPAYHLSCEEAARKNTANE
jgi:ankyrin repeat protein